MTFISGLVTHSNCHGELTATGFRLVETAARRTIGIFALARLGRALLLGVKAAFFAATDATMSPQTFENHFCRGGGVWFVLMISDAKLANVIHEVLDFRELLIALAGGHAVGNFQFTAKFEPLNHGLEIGFAKALAEHATNGSADQFTGDNFRAFQFAFIFEFHFSGDGRHGRVDISDASNGMGLASASSALFGRADDALQSGDRQALADAGAAIDALVFASLEGNFFDDFAKVIRNFQFYAGRSIHPGFLVGDGHTLLEGRGIVGADFSANAIFERRNDFAARGVVFGIGGEDEKDIERQAQRVALNLNVALLHDVEQTDLDFASKVGEFVD